MTAQRVLLTGANGFLGTHILLVLLHQGYSVRCVVRSEAIAERMRSNFGKEHDTSLLDFSVVPDVQEATAYDAPVQSDPPINYIIHVASPFWFRNNPTQRDFLLPAVKSTENLLASVARHARQVKRFVMTSSCAAVIDFARPLAEQPPKTYTAEDWNPVTYAEAEAGHLGMAYQASKKFSELKLGEVVEKLALGDAMEVTTLCPPNIYGPVLFPDSISSFAELNESNFGIYSDFIKTGRGAAADLPGDVVPWYVDVRDLASIHVRALTEPKAANQRILVPAGMASSQEIADILRENFHELESKTPKGPNPGTSSVPAGGFTISQGKLNDMLPTTFRSRTDTFVDLVNQLLDIERRAKSS